MSRLDATPLESALLRRFHEVHGANGFPNPSEVFVISREATPCGRYVGLQSSKVGHLHDGHFDLGGKYIELAGVPNGLMAVARVAGGLLHRVSGDARGQAFFSRAASSSYTCCRLPTAIRRTVCVLWSTA